MSGETTKIQRGGTLLLGSCLLGSFLLGACQGESRPDALSVIVRRADATDPVRTAQVGTVRVRVAQQGVEPRMAEAALAAGTFTIDLPITDYGFVTALDVTLERDGTTLFGALPSFVPLGYASLYVALTEAGRCESLAAPRLAAPVRGATLARFGANLLHLGGFVGDGTESARVDVLDPIALSEANAIELLRAPASLGPTSLARIGDTTTFLVASSAGNSVLVVGAGTTPRLEAISLHRGAGRATLVALGARAVAIGGEADGAATDEVSFVAGDRTLSSGRLSVARRAPHAVVVGERVFVASNVADASPFEWLSATGQSTPFGDLLPSDAVIEAIAPAPDARAVLVVVREGDADEVTSIVVPVCAPDCDLVEGPSFSLPRGPSIAHTESETWLVGGVDVADGQPSRRLVRLDLRSSPPHVTESTLVVAREGAAVVGTASGLVLVAGGRGRERLLDDAELCAPDALTAPSL